jgi:hypothetical protein
VIQVGLAILIEMYENKFYRDVSSIDKRDLVEVQRDNQTGKSDKPSNTQKKPDQQIKRNSSRRTCCIALGVEFSRVELFGSFNDT